MCRAAAAVVLQVWRLKLTHWILDKVAVILPTNSFSWIKMVVFWSKFYWDWFPCIARPWWVKITYMYIVLSKISTPFPRKIIPVYDPYLILKLMCSSCAMILETGRHLTAFPRNGYRRFTIIVPGCPWCSLVARKVKKCDTFFEYPNERFVWHPNIYMCVNRGRFY